MANYWDFFKLDPEAKNLLIEEEGEYIGESKVRDVYSLGDFWVFVGEKAGEQTFWATRDEPDL